MVHETRFKLPHGGELAAIDNQQSGPVIIAIHGFLDNAASMQFLFDAFPQHRIVAIDLPGHGKSYHKSFDAHYNQADYLQDIYSLIESQQWQDITLIGHSLGGILCSLYAALFPQHVKAVISIDSCGPLTRDAQTTAEQMRESIVERHTKSAKKTIEVDLERAVSARCKITDMNENDARVILQRNVETSASGMQIWSSDARLRTKSTLRLTEEQAKCLMESIKCPVLFIAATNSFKESAKVFEKRKTWFVNAKNTVVEGGHHVHMESPEEVSANIATFMAQM